MPFTDDEGAPLASIAVEQLVDPSGVRGARLFLLTRAFRFEDTRSGTTVVVPASDVPSDLATVPSILWGLIAPFGRQSAPALLHDHLRRELRDIPVDRRARAARRTDRLFRDALIDSGVPVPRAWVMWAAVSLLRDEGDLPSSARLRVVHAVVVAVVLLVALLRAFRGSAGCADAVRSVLAVASTALQGDRARPALVLAAVLVPLAPFAAAAWLGSKVLLAVEWAGWLAVGRRGVRPDGRPTAQGRVEAGLTDAGRTETSRTDAAR